MLLTLIVAVSAVAAQGDIFAGGPVNDIRVSVDHVVQCEQATISWTGNSGAVDVKIGLGGYYLGTNWIAEIAHQTGSSTTWMVTQAAGAGTLIFQVTDTTGAFNYVQNVAIQSSDKTSCLSGGDQGSQATRTTSTAPTDSSFVSNSGTTSSTPTADIQTKSTAESTSSKEQNSVSGKEQNSQPWLDSTSTADVTSTLVAQAPPSRIESASAGSSSGPAASVARPAANALPSGVSSAAGAQSPTVAAGVVLAIAAVVASL
ncbi:hypothetical protein CspeluHIS016_0603240 [Cutaneotrichosporon spelunceum]|uniref:Ser-Thr-rich glycosyl-phosphatidyl-inositol-anchored membrane family-domain-containing protein n=1 Tax=Cutaneotrichosporon spelunceum TaxID=1672016 RepID=A0AAD3YED6_9TREE|nr:hypothetical protein CspeluHIS016_0603240 [Cutaneotrichosporon spelunceum]